MRIFGWGLPIKGPVGIKRDAPKFLNLIIVKTTQQRNWKFQISFQTLRISAGQKAFDMSDLSELPLTLQKNPLMAWVWNITRSRFNLHAAFCG